MRKISVVFLLLLCLSLCSCMDFLKPGGPTGGGGEEEEPENFIYGTENPFYLVYDPEEIAPDIINGLIDKFWYAGVSVEPHSMHAEPEEHELVIGNVGREISTTAYSRLDRIDTNTDNDLRFCVYSSGSSLAIAYDEDREDRCLSKAIDYFEENFIDDTLSLKSGVAYQEAFDLYEYLAEVDSEYYGERWTKIATLAGEYGSDLVSALQSLYGIYDGEKIIKWLANLYDSNICVCQGLYGEASCKRFTDPDNAPAICGTGGFYYSNSGRDNYGFLPDAESTVQALGFIGSSGIAAGVGGNYVSVVPDWMGEQIVDFIYNLQDPDGFFYHPQWGKAIGNSRRSRDYNWCRNILSAYGVKTKYQTMGDLEVEETSAVLLPSRLGSSVVMAASKVVAVEGETLIPDHLKTLDAFKAYVYGQDVPNKSYVAGNNFSSQLSQIKTRPAEYGEFLIEHLNEVSNNYNNGTWHHTVNYYAVNGVMKISGVYSGLKAAIPNASLACKAAFAAVSSDQETGGIVDIWNTWEAVVRVLSNIGSYAEDGEKVVEELRKEILASAASAIIATRDKTSAYLKSDGSFSYTKTSSSANSQGVPVAVQNTNEGDVNATVIGSLYMVNSIFSSLGMNSYNVTLCRSLERAIFYDVVENLSPINKGGSASISVSPFDFDFEEEGEAPSDITVGDGSDALVIADPRGDGKVVRYISGVYPGPQGTYNNNSVKIANQGVLAGATAHIFEGEFCFEEALTTNDVFRIELGREGDAYNAYRITFRPVGDEIQLWEASANSAANNINNYLGVSARVGEWFKLKVEYYRGDHSSVRIKVYFNDELCAVSDNYYDSNGIKLTGTGTPSTDFRHTRFYALNKSNVVVLMDNLCSYGSRDNYTREELGEKYAANPYAINVDKIYDEAAVYGFEDSEPGENYPDWLTVGKGEFGNAAVSLEGEDKVLSLSGGAYVYVPVMKTARDANCSVFSMDVLANNAQLGDIAKISFAEGNAASKSLLDLTLTVATDGGTDYIYVKDYEGKILAGAKIPLGETVNLRIDFYEKEKVALIYVDGNVCSLTSALTLDAKRVRYAKAVVTSLGSSEIILDDLSAERCTKDYEAATTPKYDSKVYDFSAGLDGLSVSGSGISLQGRGDSASLKVESSPQKKGTLTIPVNNRDDIVSMTSLTLDVAFTSVKAAGEVMELAITDESGNSVISFALHVKGNEIQIYEKTALGTHKQPIASFGATSGATLKFEFYEVERICKVYVGGFYANVTSLVYSAENGKLYPAFATVTTGKTAATANIDNVSLDRVNRLYSAEAEIDTENDSPVITFDYSSGTNYSDKISASINSAAPKPSVVEVEKDGGPDKALRFETMEGNAMDYVGVSLTNPVSGAISHVFEADFMLESSKSSTPFQIWFSSGSNSAMQLNVAVSDGNVAFYHGKAQPSAIDSGVAVGEWMKLRVENYFKDNRIYAKIFVNGELLYTVQYNENNGEVIADMYIGDELHVSSVTSNGEKVVSGVTKVEFKALKATVAVCYLDNVSLSASTEEYK